MGENLTSLRLFSVPLCLCASVVNKSEINPVIKNRQPPELVAVLNRAAGRIIIIRHVSERENILSVEDIHNVETDFMGEFFRVDFSRHSVAVPTECCAM